MKLWRTLLFAAIAVGLGAYIWLVERPRIAAEAEPDKLVKLEPDKAARLRLAYPETPPIALEKKDKDWRITEPIQADADDATVANLLKQIADTKAERRIAATEAEGLGTYGLEGDGKQARVSIALDDGTKLPDIVIGNTTPVGYQAFVRVDGRDEIVIVPLILHTGVKKTVFDLRDKKLFNVDAAQGVSLTLTGDSGPIVLAREGDRWKIKTPVEAEADADQVRTLLRSLNDMNALAFYEGAEVDRAKFGLDKPPLEVQAEFGNEGTVGFRLGAKTSDSPPGYYLERSGDGEVAKIPEWVRNRFGQDLNALRDKHLFLCEPNDVAKVAYERSDGASFALVKKDGKWTMDPAPERPLKDAVVERTVGGLATLAGKDIVTDQADTAQKLAPFGLDTPVAQVEVTRTDGSPCGRGLAGVVGAATENPAYYLKRADAGTVMSVPAYLYARLDMKPQDFLEPAKEAPASEAAPPEPAPAGAGSPPAGANTPQADAEPPQAGAQPANP